MKPAGRAPTWAALALAWVAGSARAETLSLETVLHEVAARSPALEARRAEAEGARRRVATAGAWSSPMLELGVVNVPVGGGLDEDPMTMRMIGLVQRIPLSGASGLRGRSAGESSRAALAAVEAAHFEILAVAWRRYADAYYGERMALAAEEHVGVMDRVVQSARARYEAGRGRLEEVLRAEAERARVRGDAAVFRAAVEGGRVRLEALMRRSLGSADLAPLPRAGWDLDDVPPPIDHPRVRALESERAGRALGARAARRMVWPDLEVRGSYGFREDLEGGSHAQDDMFSATVGLMIPVFAGSRELAEAREMEAMARAAEAEREAAELEIGAEVAAAMAELRAATRLLALIADTVRVARRRAMEAAFGSYVAGATDLRNALDTAHELYEETLAETRAEREVAYAEARLLPLLARSPAGVRVPAPQRGRP